MGAITTLNNEIESIINNMDFISYYRVTGIEANKILLKNKSNHCFSFHVDQTTATGIVNNPGYVYISVPLEIFFLYKQNKLDDNLKTVDALVDRAEDKAHEFWNLLSQSSVISVLAEWEDYQIERLDAYKRFDPTLSGVKLMWNAPLIKTKCQ